MKNKNNCILINTEQELNDILSIKDNCFILFYAPWCPYSQEFLPIFEKCAKETSKQCYRMMIDDLPGICEKYHIDVYPTVIFFNKGNPEKRLDGKYHVGLNEQQFRQLIRLCEIKKQA